MSASVLAGGARDGILSFSRTFFESPLPAGRRITAGFSYLQRIGKPGSYDLWFPMALKRKLDALLDQGHIPGPECFPSKWAAVRQIELLQESGNHKIYDLDPGDLRRCLRDLTKSMRAGGLRVTIATIGDYEQGRTDDLRIFDKRLQEHLARMIQMLYLEDASNDANTVSDALLDTSRWNWRDVLPHIGVMLGATDVFRRENNRPRRYRLAKQFFNILGSLPQNHIVHDTAIGLQLPELKGRNQWNYIATPDETLAAFNHVLSSIFDKFNGISLSKLHERAGATGEIKASALHLRGYGDRLTESADTFYRQAALALG